MMLGSTIFLAVREIRRNLLRSSLTALGIVIGVWAVVTMITLGNGATAAVATQISSLGSNILTLRPGQGFGRGGGGPVPAPFDEADVAAISGQIGGVTAVAPQVSRPAIGIRDAANWSTTINGTTSDYLVAQRWQVTNGRGFTAAEEQAGRAVCIIGKTVRDNLFRADDPVGKIFRIGSVACEVIGLLATRGQSSFGGDQDDTVIMPIKAVQRRFTGNQDISSIIVAVDSAFATSAIQASLTSLMRERRNLDSSEENDFNIFDTKQISDTLQGTTTILTALLAAVGAVSLLVGGVGVMNVMLVSVTERTREIGIRLAIGAVASEVLLQFLIEAVVLASLGGLIGLLLALISSVLLAPVIKVPFLFNWEINVITFAFSSLIGVVFGYFPARRAAGLNPIDALRHE